MAAVTNLIGKVLELLAKEGLRKAVSWWGAQDDLKKLKETIGIIQARVRHAEQYHEAETSDLIKLWLQRLTLVLYQADDLFDEVVSLELLKQQHTEKSMLWNVGNLFTTKYDSLCNNAKLANEIKSIRKQLDDIKSDMATAFNLSNPPAQDPPMTRLLLKDRETVSSVNTENVIGRDNDRDNIIEMLLDPKKDGERLTVIPIVGFGGLGKTTLAQLVCNHDRVTNHFDLISWAYVPDKDHLNVIMKKVYESLTNKKDDNLSLERIQQGIRESIKDKKYLLVLDDLWDEREDNTELLLNSLKAGKHGSKVIVTTRSNVVARHLGPIQDAYMLETLTDEQSWKLFEKLALGPKHQHDNPAFREIGGQIVKMCQKVPLVIKVIGASLYPKPTRKEWLQVKNDLSKAEHAKDEKITTVLKLSYDYLSPKSKLCFAYCSLIPKGQQFEKDDLVYQWMAQGYVELDKAEEHFSDLVARNLFQGPNSHGAYEMHDLLHDLAKEVAGDEIMMYERPGQIHDRLVHVNLNASTCPPSLKDAKRLRSMLDSKYDANDEELYSELKSLRVLSMMELYRNEMLPNSIGRLIHLRYLKLERTNINKLPDSITRLVNLQTLKLDQCMDLQELPRDFSKLVNLRHLLLPPLLNPGMALTDLPAGFGKLTSLHKLNRFIVGEGNGIDSLPAQNLRGELEIEFFRLRRDAIEERKRANLKDNQQLTSLTLHPHFWGEESTPTSGEMKETLKCLEFPPYLEDLKILRYKGDEMPVSWFDRSSHLVSIFIFGCNLKVLPHLSLLPHLKSLSLEGLHEVEYLDEENIMVGSATHNGCFFKSLEVLKLQNCRRLKGWRRASKGDGERCQLVFPSLMEMQVSLCPMLMSIPLAPKLELLDLDEMNWKTVESGVGSNDGKEAASSSSAPPSSSTKFTSLKKLEVRWVHDQLHTLSISSSLCNLSIIDIDACSELRNMRFESPNSICDLIISRCKRLKSISEGLQHLSGLEKLDIYDCDELELEQEEEEEGNRGSMGWQGLSSLRELRLKIIPKVKTLPQGIACLTTLQKLKIERMNNLAEIPEDIGNLSQLRYLYIKRCPKVKSLPPSILCLQKLQELYIMSLELTELPGEIGNGNLPLLHYLDIRDCKNLKSFPTSIQGLASLQTLVIRGCPDLATTISQDWHLLQHITNRTISSQLDYFTVNGVEF